MGSRKWGNRQYELGTTVVDVRVPAAACELCPDGHIKCVSGELYTAGPNNPQVAEENQRNGRQRGRSGWGK